MTSTKVIKRIWKFFFRRIPIESTFAGLAYILESLHPTVMTVLSALLFEAAGGYLAGDSGAALLWGYVALMIFYLTLYTIAYSVSSVCINAGVYEKAMHLLNNDIVAAASGLPLIQYEDSEMLARRKRAEECVRNDRIPGIFMLLIVLVTSVAGILLLLVTLWTYHPLLPAIAAISVSQFFLSNWLLEREGYELEASMTWRKRTRDYIWSLFTNLGNVREMRVMGFTGHLADRWKAERDSVNEAQWRLDRKKSRYQLLCDTIKTFGYLAGVVFCLLLFRKGMISVGVFGACLVAFASVQDVVGNFFGSIGKIPGFIGLAADYFSFLDSAVPGKEELQELQEPIRILELKNVSFRYPHQERAAVKDASLTIQQGEVVSLVGVNGSGKTTLVKLLLGIYAPERGMVCYNGKNLETLDKKFLYRHAALLTQDFALYHLFLEENIALADIGRAKEKSRIREALKKVGMDGAFRENTEGVIQGGADGDKTMGRGKNMDSGKAIGSAKTVDGGKVIGGSRNRNSGRIMGNGKTMGDGKDIGNGGTMDGGKIMGKEFGGAEFSEGQKQRLALARVLFADRELVILDEPTSALDPIQESEILEEFLRLAKGRTTIIISHRVGLCRYADRVVLMQKGSIAECGSHEELMAKQGEYRKLYEMQSQWYTADRQNLK